MEWLLYAVEKSAGVEYLVPQVFERRAMQFVGARACDHVYDRCASGELGISVSHLDLELGDALEVRKDLDRADYLVAVVEAVDHEYVEGAAASGSGNFGAVALGLVAKEMNDPIGTEFGMTSDEISFGSEIGSALDHLFQRVGHEDLLYLTMSLKIQMQTGGSLAEILSRLSRLLRERAILRLKVRAISSEGRLSAVFLTVMPFVLFGVITLLQPDYFFSVRNHPIVMPALIVGLLMLATGNFIIYRMVNFKV